MLTESDVWKSNEIMSANYEAELDMNTLMKLVRAIEAEVRAEVQEPVEFPTPPNGTMAHPILGDLYDRLQMQQYAMKYAMLLAAPQPPVPCPKCENHAPFVEVGKAMVELTTTVRGVDEWPAIPTLWKMCADERDALRSKVAELETQAEININTISIRNRCISEQSEDIEHLTKVRAEQILAYVRTK